MADLYPVFDVPAVAEEEQGEEYRFPASSFFDFETGDFVTDAAGSFSSVAEVFLGEPVGDVIPVDISLLEKMELRG